MVATRLCSRCKEKKPLSKFYWKERKKRTRQSHCKECQKKYTQAYYRKNPQVYADARRRNRPKLVARVREMVRKAKDRPCTDCGEEYPYFVMQFDHVRGVKKMDIANAINRLGIESLKKEMAKCEVVCANCHAIRTHKKMHR